MARKPNLRLDLNADTNEDVELRMQAAINSPVADLAAAPEKADNNPHYDDTPSTKKMRQQYGFNSPRSDENDDEIEFDPSPAPSNDGLNGLMTQVQRPDAKPQSTPASEPADQKTPGKKEAESGGWCSCFSPGPDPESDDDNPPDNEFARQETPPARVAKKTAAVAPSPTVVVEETEEDIRREVEGLLGRRHPKNRNKKCLVIDLDETLVHSSFKPVPSCDFIVPVTIDNTVHNVYVLVRHYAAEFLRDCAEDYEIVLFTASLSKYADPLLDLLDKYDTIEYRLFRESCVNIGYSYVKDLSQLGRKMSEIMIIDNSPQSYRFQPTNAIPITSWFDDPVDRELSQLMPVLKTTLKNCNDVRDVLDASKSMEWLFRQATE